MSRLQSFDGDDADDLATATAILAHHWRMTGHGDLVFAIGRRAGLEGAAVLIESYQELRARRLRAERDAEAEDDAPF